MDRDLIRVLRLIAELLGVEQAEYCFEGRFRFALSEDWSLVISADSAGRYRLEACLASRVRATLWTRSDDRPRLEALVLAASHEAALLAA